MVALRTGVDVTKGDIYTISALKCCPGCGLPTVELVEINRITNLGCYPGCQTIVNNVRSAMAETCFAPLQSNSDAIEYRLNVSIKELEVKEYQNQ